MKIRFQGRGTGKTHDLIQDILADEDLIFLAASNGQAKHAHKLAAVVDPQIPRSRFWSPYELQRRIANEDIPKGAKFVIDELDRVLSAVFGEVVTATYTGEITAKYGARATTL